MLNIWTKRSLNASPPNALSECIVSNFGDRAIDTALPDYRQLDDIPGLAP